MMVIGFDNLHWFQREREAERDWHQDDRAKSFQACWGGLYEMLEMWMDHDRPAWYMSLTTT